MLEAKSSARSGLETPPPPSMGHGAHSREGHGARSRKGHGARGHEGMARMAAKGMAHTAARGTMRHVHVALKCLSSPRVVAVVAVSCGAWWALEGHGTRSHEGHGTRSREGMARVAAKGMATGTRHESNRIYVDKLFL